MLALQIILLSLKSTNMPVSSDMIGSEVDDSELLDYLNVAGLPARFASLADATVIVAGISLPVHSTILAANSSIFTEAFLTGTEDTNADGRRSISVPVTAHSLLDVRTALTYLYERTVDSTVPLKLGGSVSQAQAILSFAHKHSMKCVLQECESSLIKNVAHSTGLQLHTKNATLVLRWLALAESCGLNRFTASLEQFVIANCQAVFWRMPDSQKAMISVDSLLRILRGLVCCVSRPSEQVVSPVSRQVSVETLLDWQLDKITEDSSDCDPASAPCSSAASSDGFSLFD